LLVDILVNVRARVDLCGVHRSLFALFCVVVLAVLAADDGTILLLGDRNMGTASFNLEDGAVSRGCVRRNVYQRSCSSELEHWIEQCFMIAIAEVVNETNEPVE
jgi:hypothetical protein